MVDPKLMDSADGQRPRIMPPAGLDRGFDLKLFATHPPHPLRPAQRADQDRVSEFELKLMDITSENLGIPETEYSATVG